MLQIAAYSSLLDFGLQTAVGRFVAQMTELGLSDRRKELVETSLTVFVIAAGLAMLLVGSAVLGGNHLFSGMPESVLHEFRIAGLVLGAGAAAQLIFGTFTGVLVGLHKNEIPAVTTLVTRLGGALLVIEMARHSHSLVSFATAITVTNVCGGIFQYAAVIYLLPELRRLKLGINSGTVRELIRFCFSLGLLTLSTFLIQGVDISIVGRYQFDAVGYYTIATSVIAVMVGFDNAVLSAFMAPLAAFHARSKFLSMANRTLDATWVISIANGLVLLFFSLFGRVLLQVWVGTAYATLAFPVLEVLLLAQTIRLISGPLTTALIAANLHGRAVPSGVAEATVNFVASIYLMRTFGAIGVAFGTLIGSVVSVMIHMLYTLNTVKDLPVNRGQLMSSGVGLPVLALSPLILMSVAKIYGVHHYYNVLLLSSILLTIPAAAWSWKIQKSSRDLEVVHAQ